MIALSSVLCTIVVHLFFRADTFCKMPVFLKKVISFDYQDNEYWMKQI
jgi:hypothetical protein